MTIKRAFTILVGLVLVAMGIYETLDPDMWWHLRVGEIVWQSGIPDRETLSFTRVGAEWVVHEWLTDTMMWLTVSTAGLTGLSVLFSLLSASAFILAFLASPARPYLAGAVTLLAAFAASPSFGARPQVMNMLFMALFVFVVERVRSGAYPLNRLLLLPVFTIAWVNFHSGYLLGVAVLATYAAGDCADRVLPLRTERSSGCASGPDNRVRWLLGVAAGCLLAALANPSGWEIWTFAIGTLGSDLIQQNIVEWSSPDFHDPLYWPFAGLLFLGVVSWAAAPRSPGWSDVLLFLGTAAAGLVSTRHIALFSVVAVPVVSRTLYENVRQNRLFQDLHSDDERPVNRVASALNWTIVVLGAIATFSWSAVKLADNEQAIAREFPVAAVDFIEREGMTDQRVYNTYVWGGYLIWRGLRPFADGRAEVYGDFLGEYLQTFRLTENWREPLDAYAVDYALLERDNSLVTLLVASGDWHLVYEDDVARILVRDRGEGARRERS